MIHHKSMKDLSRYRDIGVLVIRLAFGFQLIRVSYTYALFPAENIPGFVDYLTSLGVPFPTPGAYLATYTEFVGGILLLLGLYTRWTAVFLIVNFSVAFGVAHISIGDTYQNTFPSLNLLAVSIFLLLNGPGRYALTKE